MKLGLLLVGLTAVVAVGCSDETDSAKSGPVSSAPLAGTVEGKSFTGKFAVAQGSAFDDTEERMISIYDTELTCDSYMRERPEAYLLLSVPWKAGTARDFSFGGEDGQTATFVVKESDGEVRNIISTDGRVEVIEAPTEAGAKGKIRLRAAAKGNSVEGEVAVEVCP